MRDLRSFIADHRDSVWRIAETVAARHELTALQHELDRIGRYPILLAERISDLAGRPSGIPVVTNLTASRISRDRVRKIRFFQPQSYLSIDYAAQEVEHYALGPGPNGTPAITGGKLEVERDEPLRRELEDFVTAVRTGRPPQVTGEQGRAALALAAEIVERMAHVR